MITLAPTIQVNSLSFASTASNFASQKALTARLPDRTKV
jgi:hypothetical protein